MHRLAAELPEEEMTPGRWHGASLGMPKRSTSREELKQAIARKKSDGDVTQGGRAAAAPAQQVTLQAPAPRPSAVLIAPPFIPQHCILCENPTGGCQPLPHAAPGPGPAFPPTFLRGKGLTCPVSCRLLRRSASEWRMSSATHGRPSREPVPRQWWAPLLPLHACGNYPGRESVCTMVFNSTMVPAMGLYHSIDCVG